MINTFDLFWSNSNNIKYLYLVEQVKSDGSILISESNVRGLGVISYRTFDAETAKQFTYVIGK